MSSHIRRARRWIWCSLPVSTLLKLVCWEHCCPVLDHRSGSPVLHYRSGSPVLHYRSGSLVLHYEPDSPLLCYRSGSPVLHYESDFCWCWPWSREAEAESRLAAVLDHWRDGYRDVAIFAARVTELAADLLGPILARLENEHGWLTSRWADVDLRPASATAASRQRLAEVPARTRTIDPAAEGRELRGAERHGLQFRHSGPRGRPGFRPGLDMPVPGGLCRPGRVWIGACADHRICSGTGYGRVQLRAVAAAGPGCRGVSRRPRGSPPARPRHRDLPRGRPMAGLRGHGVIACR